jgi:hypothetical protein
MYKKMIGTLIEYKIILFLLLIVILSIEIVTASYHQTSDEIIEIISNSLPKDWKIFSINESVKPAWSFSDDRCKLLIVYGPKMSGYTYYDNKNHKIKSIRYKNEAKSIWIVPKNFDPKWTLKNRVKNRFRKTPVKYPNKIIKLNEVTVWGCESKIIKPEYLEISKKSPKGTKLAVGLETEDGGSWNTWIEDLRKNLRTVSK